MHSIRQVRREIGLFLAFLVVFSAVFYGLLLFVPSVRERWLAYSGAFMWCPGAAAILAQLVLNRSLRGLGWGWGGLRYYLLACGVPLAFCLPVYSIAWLPQLGGFGYDLLEAQRSRIGLPPGLVGNLGLIFLVWAQAAAGMAGSLGEELGWRGFLVPRLAALTNFTKTSLIVGCIWSLWHYPVIVTVLPLYLPRLPLWYATACFTVSVVAISFVYTWLRLRSGSVWPAALLHAGSNAFQGAFESLTKHNEWTSYWTYEYGVGFSLVVPILAFVFWKRRGDVEPQSL